MIATIFNQNTPSNVDTLRQILSYLTKDDYVTFGLINKDYMCVMEENRRQRVKESRMFVKAFNDAEEIIETNGNQLICTRLVNTDVFRTSYMYDITYVPEISDSRIISVKQTMNDLQHGYELSLNGFSKTLNNYKHGKLNGIQRRNYSRYLYDEEEYVNGKILCSKRIDARGIQDETFFDTDGVIKVKKWYYPGTKIRKMKTEHQKITYHKCNSTIESIKIGGKKTIWDNEGKIIISHSISDIHPKYKTLNYTKLISIGSTIGLTDKYCWDKPLEYIIKRIIREGLKL